MLAIVIIIACVWDGLSVYLLYQLSHSLFVTLLDIEFKFLFLEAAAIGEGVAL